jgi:hypothetical protein
VPVRVSLVAAPIEIMHRHGHVIRPHACIATGHEFHQRLD